MKKLISFSLWGTDPKYLVGAEENLRLQKKIYPDWVCRYYVDLTVPPGTIQKLQDGGAEILYRNISDGYWGLFWRFEVGFDDTCERFIVRDCDSRLNEREAYAIKEWEESGLPFHCMRDHRGHDIPILGAMWGAKSFFLPDYQTLFESFLSTNVSAPVMKRDKFFYSDQIFLNKVIWPRVFDIAIVHDDFQRITGRERFFKVRLPDGLFIGQQFGADNKPLPVPI